MLTWEQLKELQEIGWQLTRDGSTATARFLWEDPEEPDSAWEALVLQTSGHGTRFTLQVHGEALTEIPLPLFRQLQERLREAELLCASWEGELPEDPAP